MVGEKVTEQDVFDMLVSEVRLTAMSLKSKSFDESVHIGDNERAVLRETAAILNDILN